MKTEIYTNLLSNVAHCMFYGSKRWCTEERRLVLRYTERSKMSEPQSRSQQQHTNRLIHETSPYLLQHAHNPVDWYPWGEEALQKARQEDKPILLSVGYSACHWCHVMEHESFENE